MNDMVSYPKKVRKLKKLDMVSYPKKVRKLKKLDRNAPSIVACSPLNRKWLTLSRNDIFRK